MFLKSEIIEPIVNSATASTGALGVENIFTLFFFASLRSILSVPDPTLEIILILDLSNTSLS